MKFEKIKPGMMQPVEIVDMDQLDYNRYQKL